MDDLQLRALKPRETLYEVNDDGLIIKVFPNGSKTFAIRISVNGKRKYRTLGKYPQLSLAEARSMADGFLKRAEKQRDPGLFTFRKAFDEWYAGQVYQNEKVKANVKNRLERYIMPELGNIPITELKPPMVFDCLKPYEDKSETVRKTLSYVNQVLNYHVAKGTLPGNPCATLIKAFRLKSSTPMPALSYKDLAELKPLMDKIKECRSHDVILLALLTLLRPGELTALRWEWIGEDVITIPAAAMKMNREHRVPLTPQMQEVLSRYPRRDEGYVFATPTGHFQQDSVNKLLRENGFRDKLVMHGFRSMGRTWMAEQMIRFEVAEACLAHQEKSAVVRAYSRSDYLDERREVMLRWNEYVTGQIIESTKTL